MSYDRYEGKLVEGALAASAQLDEAIDRRIAKAFTIKDEHRKAIDEGLQRVSASRSTLDVACVALDEATRQYEEGRPISDEAKGRLRSILKDSKETVDVLCATVLSTNQTLRAATESLPGDAPLLVRGLVSCTFVMDHLGDLANHAAGKWLWIEEDAREAFTIDAETRSEMDKVGGEIDAIVADSARCLEAISGDSPPQQAFADAYSLLDRIGTALDRATDVAVAASDQMSGDLGELLRFYASLHSLSLARLGTLSILAAAEAKDVQR